MHVWRRYKVHTSSQHAKSEKAILCVSPQSVCFDLPMIPACDLSTCPTQSHVHFLWGQRRIPGSRWLSGSGAVPGSCCSSLTVSCPGGCSIKEALGQGAELDLVSPSRAFASQCEGTFPLFNVHFPHDMRISMTLCYLVFSLLLAAYTSQCPTTWPFT